MMMSCLVGALSRQAGGPLAIGTIEVGLLCLRQYKHINRMSAPLEKLDTLLEDIVEAEDSLAPDGDISDLSPEFFSSLSEDTSHPMLHPNIIRKLTTCITKVARPNKRSRQNTRDRTHSGSPKTKVAISDLETATLGRVLRLLERSVKAGEDIDPFGSLHHAGAEQRSPSKKAAKKKIPKDERRSESRPADDREEADNDFNTPSSEGPTTADLDTLAKTLQVARDSVYAADCCIALLSSDRLTKQVCNVLYEPSIADGMIALFRRTHHNLSGNGQKSTHKNHISICRGLI